MDPREEQKLLVKATAHLQKTLDDAHRLGRACAALADSLKDLSAFFKETGLEELSPVDNEFLLRVANEVDELAKTIDQVKDAFTKKGLLA
jgi:predicted HicB family RNase H-like nuclease